MIILLFYPKQYKIYGIGTSYIEQDWDKKWTYLPEISKLCHHQSLISKADRNLFVIDSVNNELYGAGRNSYGALGIVTGSNTVTAISKIEFYDTDLKIMC